MILDRYLAGRFLRAWAGTLAAFFLLLALAGLVEQVRRFADDAEGLGAIVALTLLDVPRALYAILPLVTIIAAIALFLALARSSELVVTQGAGRGAIRALLGPALVALALGAVAVSALNPIVAATTREFESRVGRLDGRAAVELSDDGLWLRQGGEDGQTVIRAARSNLDGTVLSGVTFLTFDPGGSQGGSEGGSEGPSQRIEARTARLTDGRWWLSEAKAWALDAPNPEAAARVFESYAIPSTLTADQIRDSFGTPASIPIWELPRFIERLRAAGFSARRHVVFLHMELAQPLVFLAMVLIAACFTLRPQRGRRTGVMVLGAILTGFAAYFLRNFAQVLGEAGQVPAALAAWAPPVVAIGLALGMLLHLEDG